MKLQKCILAAALLTAVPAVAGNHKGDNVLGPKLGFISKNTSALAGIVYQHSFSDRVRLSPEIGYVFRHNNLDAFILDVNVHTPFGIGGDSVDLYPLAGLTFNSWGHHGISPIDGEDVTTHTNRWGLNLGAGFDLRCSSTLRFNVEARYALVKSFSSFQFTASVAYVF